MVFNVLCSENTTFTETVAAHHLCKTMIKNPEDNKKKTRKQ